MITRKMTPEELAEQRARKDAVAKARISDDRKQVRPVERIGSAPTVDMSHIDPFTRSEIEEIARDEDNKVTSYSINRRGHGEP
jgi:hypothetical protein